MTRDPSDVLAEAAAKLENLSDEALEIFTAQGRAMAGALDLPIEARRFGAVVALVGESARTGLVDWDLLLELGEAARAVEGGPR